MKMAMLAGLPMLGRVSQTLNTVCTWTMIVWGARLGSMLMALIGAWAVVRAALGLMDRQASDQMLAKLDEEENAPMGDA